MDEYINTFPENIRQILQRFRKVIKEAAPDAVEKISYAMPTLPSKAPGSFRCFYQIVKFRMEQNLEKEPLNK